MVLVDGRSRCRQTVVFTGQARDYVSLGQRVFPIESQGRRTIETELTLNLPGFTFDDLRFQFPLSRTWWATALCHAARVRLR